MVFKFNANGFTLLFLSCILIIFCTICWIPSASSSTSQKDDDVIGYLPGLNFEYNHHQYSGYFKLASKSNLHYWFLESQSDPANDPLMLWISGGPGCSSIFALVTEMGPFFINSDGKTLFENVYSWNKIANILFFDNPRDVGFSYSEPNTTDFPEYNDDNAVIDIISGLRQFLVRFPEYNRRDFYVFGESYAGIWSSVLTKEIISRIKEDPKSFNLNFVGLAIGNGFLSLNHYLNSYVNMAMYKGFIGKEDFDFLKDNCCKGVIPVQNCNFSDYLYGDEHAKIHVRDFNTSVEKQCAERIFKIADDQFLHGIKGYYSYNINRDCYVSPDNFTRDNKTLMKAARYRQAWELKTDDSLITDGLNRFVDQGSLINKLSTDQLGGFYCYTDDMSEIYLNRADVRQALKIPASLDGKKFQLCGDLLDKYKVQYFDTTDFFQWIFDSGYPLKLLIYNGDLDGVCNFLGVSTLVHSFGLTQLFDGKRVAWRYQKDSFVPMTVGYVERFQKGNVLLDLLTLSGGGHMLPRTMPGPSLQMFANFLTNDRNYSRPLNFNPIQGKARVKNPVPPAMKISRKQADVIHAIPGMTSTLYYKQHAGYLSGGYGTFLHYWLLESQTNPLTDPLLIWIGSDDCTSLKQLLTEHGPFHPNPDGKTLYENVFAWNKGTNMLYLDTSRSSLSKRAVKIDATPDDLQIIAELYMSLKDFIDAYPEYANRALYLAGDSYAAVYVASLADRLIREAKLQVQHGIKLTGLIIGNGMLSDTHIINSIIPVKYHRAYIGKRDWDSLAECCTEVSYKNLPRCDFSKYLKFNGSLVDVSPADDSMCASRIASMSQPRIRDAAGNQIVNIYNDCYETDADNTQHLGSVLLEDKRKRDAMDNDALNFYSTDSQGGFPCFGKNRAEEWLNFKDVKRTLRIPNTKENLRICRGESSADYVHQIRDTSFLFDAIVKSNYPLKILIYNGDLDITYNAIGAQWFVEDLVKRNSLNVVKPHEPWIYHGKYGGYVKRFGGNKTSLDLLTIKGAGRAMAMDRPGPALQMITNFITGRDYSTPVQFKTDFTPLFKEYQIKEAMSDSISTNKPPKKVTEWSHKSARINPLISQNVISDRRVFPLFVNAWTDNPKTEKPIWYSDRPKTAAPPAHTKEQDRITQLKGLTFPMSAQYSGYLNATKGTFLHYWFVTSQNKPDTDPLVLWLNGGPGASSLMGLFEIIGPFKFSRDGTKLYENYFSWTKVANVLFLEAPRGVGFSYSTDDAEVGPNDEFNDDLAARDNALALKSFFDRFPEFNGRPFYLAGESYGGIYLPTLARELLKIIETNPHINLAGLAIGNPYLNSRTNLDSIVPLAYFKGYLGLSYFDGLTKCCSSSNNSKTENAYPLENCELTKYVDITNNYGYVKKDAQNSTIEECGNALADEQDMMWISNYRNPYNTYTDCYSSPYDDLEASESPSSMKVSVNRREAVQDQQSKDSVLSNVYDFTDQRKLLNLDSTDQYLGMSCSDPLTSYLQDPDVMEQIHVPIPWYSTIDDFKYDTVYYDTSPVFKDILERAKSSGKYLKVLIFNGDADMVCNFLLAQWFIEKLASDLQMNEIQSYQEWTFTQPSTESKFVPVLAGFSKKFSWSNDMAFFSLVTVKGAGHMASQDRPGPMLHLFNNFINNKNLSAQLPSDIIKSTSSSPVNDDKNPHDQPSKRLQDKIWNLPGLTFTPNFAQYSGYLNGNMAGNYLFYWLLEPQYNRETAPVLLWLTGGPGCSSIGSLIMENGPFRVNRDGRTLFENIYSWNKAAYIIYLDSPRGVGFSYQNMSQNPSREWNEELTAQDTLAALKQLYDAYGFLNGRDLYITGESYAGVYVPTLVNYMVKEFEKDNNGMFNGHGVNLKGMVIGNAYFSAKWTLATIFDYLYFHGILQKSQWDAIRTCCVPPNEVYCNLPEDIECEPLENGLLDQLMENPDHIDLYNIYQQCYEMESVPEGLRAHARLATPMVELSTNSSKTKHRFKNFLRKYMVHHYNPSVSLDFEKKANKQPVMDFGLDVEVMFNYASNDPTFSYPCYSLFKIDEYFDQVYVREALHVPDFVQKWAFCSDTINALYDPAYLHGAKDMNTVLNEILDSDYVQQRTKEPFRILLYNGDSDIICSFIKGEFFIEDLVEKNEKGRRISGRHPWYYKTSNTSSVAGFLKSYEFSQNSNTFAKLDLLTVKGAGHLVPLDRPAQALQMLQNFLANISDYSIQVPYSLQSTPLKKQYQPLATNESAIFDSDKPNSVIESTIPASPLTTPKAEYTPKVTTPASSGTNIFMEKLLISFSLLLLMCLHCLI